MSYLPTISILLARDAPSFWLSKPPKMGMSHFSKISVGKHSCLIKVIFKTEKVFFVQIKKFPLSIWFRMYELLMNLGVECSAQLICSNLPSSVGFQHPLIPQGLMGGFEFGRGRALEQWWKCPDFWFLNVGRYQNNVDSWDWNQCLYLVYMLMFDC